MSVADFTDDQIVAAIGQGGRAYHICYAIGRRGTVAFRAMHLRLRKLESAGRVFRCPWHSAVNSIYWRVAACAS